MVHELGLLASGRLGKSADRRTGEWVPGGQERCGDQIGGGLAGGAAAQAEPEQVRQVLRMYAFEFAGCVGCVSGCVGG